jgi:catalase
MLHTPMFFAKVPKGFIDKLTALKRDPATGKPDREKVKAFAATHPDNTSQAKFLEENNPPPSYANCAFYSMHTFKFLNRDNNVTLVWWHFVPQGGERQMSEVEVASAPNDFLCLRLLDRARQGPIRWDMIVTIGEPGDSETDPTILWPATRREVKVGTLTITSVIPEEEAGSYRINFDPLVMADGIAPPDDPILLFRSPSYAFSYMRRLCDV